MKNDNEMRPMTDDEIIEVEEIFEKIEEEPWPGIEIWPGLEIIEIGEF